MARPRVELVVPTELFAGREHTVEIVIEVDEPVRVDFVDVSLIGDEGWHSHRRKFPELEQRLLADAVLAPGEPRCLPWTFELPATMAPTHELGQAWSRTLLGVHVSIPWRRDVRVKRWLTVRRPPQTTKREPARSPIAMGDPRQIELGLASRTVVAGERLAGSCAAPDAPCIVQVSLRSMLVLHPEQTWPGPTVDLEKVVVETPGTTVRFELAIPADLTPSFAAATHELRWSVWAASSKGLWGGIWIELLDAEAAHTTPPVTVAPVLGGDHVRTELARFVEAHPRWSVIESVRRSYLAAIESRVGDTTLTVAYASSPEWPSRLVARLDYPWLGLALDVVAKQASLLSRDIQVELPEWDRAHHVEARDAEQALAFLRLVVPLLHAYAWARLARWDDGELALFVEAPATAFDQQQIRRLASILEPLAHAIESARNAIPPPSFVTYDPAAWHELARWLGTTPKPGDLTIEGTRDGAHVLAVLRWKRRRVEGVRVIVSRGATFKYGPPSRVFEHPAADRDPALQEVADLVGMWPADFGELWLHEHYVAGNLDVANALDATRVRALIDLLLDVRARLWGTSTGPYR